MPTTRKSSTKVSPVKQSKPKQLPSGREASKNELASLNLKGIASVLSVDQVNILSNPTPEYAKKIRPGGGGKALTYVPHGYVTTTLNKAFGFDWDYILKPVFNGSIVQQTDVYIPLYKLPVNASPQAKAEYAKLEAKTVSHDGKPCNIQHNLTVYGELTVRIRNAKGEIVATITKPGPGSAIWHEENEYGDAVKSAKSDGLKVAAHELGIALDLYFDEDAAIDEYQQKQNDAATAIEAASMPSNPFELLARAQSDYKLDGQTLCAKLQIDMPVLLAVTDPETIRGYWRTLGGNNASHKVID